ncbi:MAG: UDP-N-acetylglucosamine pyrophosphorylase [Clostridia bacterium]|nr:UDP-N-acetylglucosamine pyrophosphorylase [Clostridia bacterium]
MLKTNDLFDLSHSLAAPLLEKMEYPWEALDKIKDFILALGPTLPQDEYEEIAPQVWVAKDAQVFPSAYLGAPCIIGHKTEVRHCAFIRGSALIGDGAVVGNSVEIKNAILFDGVQVPHFNYVGDSIMGYKSHMGAGSVTSNVKSDKTPVVVKNGEEQLPTGRKKFGAMVGDLVEVGCNSVLNPGTVLGKRASVYPTSCVRGVIPADHIYKDKDHILPRR